jgi:hypothetical protein
MNSWSYLNDPIVKFSFILFILVYREKKGVQKFTAHDLIDSKYNAVMFVCGFIIKWQVQSLSLLTIWDV